MSGKDDSEEATLEPTPQKLKQLRDKGQIPRSQEVTGAVTLITVLFYVLATYDSMIDSFAIAFVDNPVFNGTPFDERLHEATRMMVRLTLELALPVMGIAIVGALVATMLDVGGFLFSMESLTPNFAKFNPAEGIKNIFALKSLIDLLKSTAKIIIFFVCIYFILRGFLGDVIWSPTCGMGCIFDVGGTIILYIILISTFLILIFAAIDFVIARILFKRDNMMTQTEMKREMKESFGDPHVRGERNRIRKEMADTAGLVGPKAANLWIAGPNGMIGIAYKPEQSGVPMLAAKALADNETQAREVAHENGIAIESNPELFKLLITEGKIGQPIPRESFTEVAQALVRAGFSG